MFAGMTGLGALAIIYLCSLVLLLVGIGIGRGLGVWRRRGLSDGDAQSILSLQGSALALLG